MGHRTHEVRCPKIRVLGLALVLAAAGTPAFGGSGFPDGGMHHGKFWKKSKVRHELQLTDDEVRTLEHIFARNQQTLTDLEADVERKKDELDTLFTLLIADERADEGKVLAQVDQFEKSRARLRTAGAAIVPEMRSLIQAAAG